MRHNLAHYNKRFHSQEQVAMRESVQLNYDIAAPNWEDYRPSDTSIPIVEELPAPAGLFQAAAPSALPGCGASSGVGGVGSLFESLPLPDGASATQASAALDPPATEPSEPSTSAAEPPSPATEPPAFVANVERLRAAFAMMPPIIHPWLMVEASPPAETSDAEVLYKKDADDDPSSDEVVMF